MKHPQTHNRGSKKYVLMSLDDFNDYFKKSREEQYAHIRKQTLGKLHNKGAIQKAVNAGVKQFRKDHPTSLDGRWQFSLVKRISGMIYCWAFNNAKLSDLIVEKD